MTPAQRTALLDAINSAQEGIEKLRKELVAYNGVIKQLQVSPLYKTYIPCKETTSSWLILLSSGSVLLVSGRVISILK